MSLNAIVITTITAVPNADDCLRLELRCRLETGGGVLVFKVEGVTNEDLSLMRGSEPSFAIDLDGHGSIEKENNEITFTLLSPRGGEIESEAVLTLPAPDVARALAQ